MAEPPVYTEARIEQCLADDPRVAELGLRATVQPPRVFLRGEVPSAQRRDRAAQIVRELLPDFEVHNEIAVTGTAEPDSAEELQ